jgi:hypothetical protein
MLFWGDVNAEVAEFDCTTPLDVDFGPLPVPAAPVE